MTLKAPPTIRHPRPEGNGTQGIIGSRKYRKWRARIAMQRMNRCDVCWLRDNRITSYKHMHHIKSRESHPELVMDADNVQLLCEAHHDEAHGKGPT